MGSRHLAPKEEWSEIEDKTLAALIFVKDVGRKIFEKQGMSLLHINECKRTF